MKLSAILAPLIAAKLPHEIIMQTVQAWEAEQEVAVDASKEKARARWHKWKAKKGATVGKRLQTIANNSCAEEYNLQGKNISGKEERKEASPSARPSRGTRIPDDFQPDIEAAIAEGVPRLEAERQARSFCDYWRSKPGKDGLKLDWPATWRVWYRRSIPTHSPPRHAAAPPNGMERMNRLLDEMQGKASEQPSTIETSFERTDSGSTASLIQFDAFAARR